MKKPEKEFDLPLQIFHFLFATIFTAVFTIGNLVDEEDPFFSVHMLGGLFLLFIVILRVMWGFVGPKISRFASFSLSLRELLNYFQSVLKKVKLEYPSHNPATSFVAITMFALTIFLVSTGLAMTFDVESDFIHEGHEVAATLFAILAATHILGVINHMVRVRENILLSMFYSSKKEHKLVAALFVTLCLLLLIYLYLNYEYSSQTLTLWGKELILKKPEY